MFVQTETTPNPNSLKFLPGKIVSNNGSFEINKKDEVKNELITDRDLEKLQNSLETQFVNRNASIEGIANSLSDYYTFYGDTGLINSELDIYRSITKEEIRDVAKKYLNSNQRVIVDYLPGDETNKTIIE